MSDPTPEPLIGGIPLSRAAELDRLTSADPTSADPTPIDTDCPDCPSKAGERCRYWVPQEGGWGTYRAKPHARRRDPDMKVDDDD